MTGLSKRSVRIATKMVDDARTELHKAIRHAAKHIVLNYPMVTEYFQGMGSAGFVVRIGDREFNVSPSEDSSKSVQRIVDSHDDDDELDPILFASLGSFADAVREVNELFDVWYKLFNYSASGEPFRVGKDGNIITDW